MAKAKTKSSKKINLNAVRAFCITCENTHEIISTLAKDFKIDTCSKCHPFYLGTQKFESKAGRMERFRKLTRKSQEMQKKLELVEKPSINKNKKDEKKPVKENKKNV